MSRATASEFNPKVASQGLTKLSNISLQGLPGRYPSSSSKYHRIVPRAMTGESEEGTAYGLPIDLRGVALLDLRNYPFIFGAYFFGLLKFKSVSAGVASVSLTYIACERTIPGYNVFLTSSSKSANIMLTLVLVFEAGRKGQIRVNTISAGPLGSRAAKAIGFIEKMIDYSYSNLPLQKELLADEVGNTSAFLVSPLASAVDSGLNTMDLQSTAQHSA
ncbi:hypothetical protein C4D60_Mb03t11060 [Musa balbisiana]|uniref:Uncharacterized protein n=1 Tax=Musa balbisiana TaxID=52838 RepID=A0A4S8JBH1_MUSBA|nr:hypothetical protein C4D60_Mb03t11060 [Musa balbisiana]